MPDARRDWLADYGQLYIRHVPKSVIAAAKERAKTQQRTLQEMVVMMLQAYAAGLIDINALRVPANPVHHEKCPRRYSSKLRCVCEAMGRVDRRVPCSQCGRKTRWNKKTWQRPEEVYCPLCLRATLGQSTEGVYPD